MNNERRKEIAEAIKLLVKARDAYENAATILESCKDEEEEAFENLPEGLQSSDRGETMEQNVEYLQTAIDELDNIE